MIVGPERLAENILDPNCLTHGPNSTTGNNSGSWGSGFEEHLAPTKFRINLVGNSMSGQGHALKIPLGVFASLANALGNLISFSKTIAHLACVIARHH